MKEIEDLQENHHTRILPIDGLRAIASFGVVWVHVWAFFGNPSGSGSGFGIYNLISVVGNGVDFFFVISGFCMYLVTKENITAQSFGLFMKKRAVRILPAYFFALIVYACFIKWNDPSFQLFFNVSIHFLFLNNIVSGNNISAPFWSLATEWHFYLILPIVIWMAGKVRLLNSLVVISVCCIIVACFMHLGYLPFRWWENQIVIRFPEFAFGMGIAYFYLNEIKLPRFFGGLGGLLLGFAILMFGRVCNFQGFLQLTGEFSFLARALFQPILCLGFSIILYNVINHDTLLSRMLSSRPMIYLGRISFSVYLWHSLVIILLESLLVNLPFGALNVLVGFLLVSLPTLFIAHFSYKYLEAFYFKRKNVSQRNSLSSTVGPALQRQNF